MLKLKLQLIISICHQAEYHFAHEHSESYEIYLVDLEKEHIDGPHSIDEFEASKTTTQYRFSYNMQ